MKLEFEETDDILIAHGSEGWQSNVESEPVYGEIFKLAREKGYRAVILNDSTFSKVTIAEAMYEGQVLARHAGDIHVAYIPASDVNRAHSQVLRFSENIARNMGASVQVFYDIDSAAGWLRRKLAEG